MDRNEALDLGDEFYATEWTLQFNEGEVEGFISWLYKKKNHEIVDRSIPEKYLRREKEKSNRFSTLDLAINAGVDIKDIATGRLLRWGGKNWEEYKITINRLEGDE